MTQSRKNLIILLVSYIDKVILIGHGDLGTSQDPRCHFKEHACQRMGIKCSKGLDVPVDIQGTSACSDNPLKEREKLLHFELCTMLWGPLDFGGNIYHLWVWCSDLDTGSVLCGAQWEDLSKSRPWYTMPCHLSLITQQTCGFGSVCGRWGCCSEPLVGPGKASQPRSLPRVTGLGCGPFGQLFPLWEAAPELFVGRSKD